MALYKTHISIKVTLLYYKSMFLYSFQKLTIHKLILTLYNQNQQLWDHINNILDSSSFRRKKKFSLCNISRLHFILSKVFWLDGYQNCLYFKLVTKLTIK